MANPASVTGTLSTLTGGKIAQGKVIFQLTNIGTGNPIGVSGTSIIPALTYTAMTDQAGNFSLNLWGNDNLIPANTLYNVTFRDFQGNEIGPITYSITGASVNLNTAAATNTTTPPVLTAGAVLLNPLVTQNIVQPSGTSLNVNRFEQIRYADQFSGATADVQINAAIADLPATGGTVDARGLIGAQTIATTVTVGGGSTKPVKLLLSAGVNYSGTVSPMFNVLVGSSIVGDGWSERTPTQGSKISFSGTGNAVQVGSSNSNNSDAVNLESITIDLTGSGPGSIGTRVYGCFHQTYRRLNIQGTPTTGWSFFLDTNLNPTGAQHLKVEQCRGNGRLHLEGLGSKDGVGQFQRVTTACLDTLDFFSYEFMRTGNLLLNNVTGESTVPIAIGPVTINASPGGLTRANNVVTLKATSHGIPVGAPIQVSSTTLATGTVGFNGVFSVLSVPDANTLTYVQGGDAATGGAGTVTTIAANYIFADCTSVTMSCCDIEGNSTNAIWMDANVLNFLMAGGDFGGFTGTNRIAPSSGTPPGNNPITGFVSARSFTSDGTDPTYFLSPVLQNTKLLYGRTTGGSARGMVQMDSSNRVVIGNTTDSNLLLQALANVQMPNAVFTVAAPTVAASQVGLGSTTATSATAGSNGAAPSQVAGYLIINVAGTAMKIPYYNT
jgi:hypothetical protein